MSEVDRDYSELRDIHPGWEVEETLWSDRQYSYHIQRRVTRDEEPQRPIESDDTFYYTRLDDEDLLEKILERTGEAAAIRQVAEEMQFDSYRDAQRERS